MLSKAYFFEKMLPSIFYRWDPLPISIFKFAMLFSLIRHIYLNIIKLNLFSRKIKRRRYRLKIFNVRSSYRDGISNLYFRAFRIFLYNVEPLFRTKKTKEYIFNYLSTCYNLIFSKGNVCYSQ